MVVFLGLMNDIAHFAIDVSHHDEPPFGDHGEFHDLRRGGARLEPADVQVQFERTLGVLPGSQRRRGAEQTQLCGQFQRIQVEHVIGDRFGLNFHLHRADHLDVTAFALDADRSDLAGFE